MFQHLTSFFMIWFGYYRLSIEPTDYQIKDLSGWLWMDFWYLFDYTLIWYFKR